VLLVRLGAEVFAVENRCAHLGCPLTLGRLDGHVLQCPCHDWRFDVRDGRFLDAPELALKKYAAEIKDGKVYVRLP
jgi:3-phenylpropionate/trans-cinnamate dioxygenase ferredoxin subunit